MAITPVTVTVDFNDFIGEDYNPRQARLLLSTNVASGWLVDTTTDGAFRVGGARIQPDDSGVATASVLPSGATGLEPAAYQIRFAIEAPNLRTRKTETFDLGWYTITAATNLKDEVAEQYVPPTYMTTAQATLQGYVTEAEAARDAAVDISNIDTSDGVVSALVEGTGGAGPLTRSALSASYVDFWSPVDNGDGTFTLPVGLATDNNDGTYTIGAA